ncbi:hypothetical protein [Pirellula sp. SH-Sr6A]|uniref:hypothetical protein n=1 Tax=Pirellula sp. SH-Sr6A TaxID=1632865 RepID=UPI00143BD98D|nr:hypothetical protein [Pirellula sp. SH-Sr6A]
MSTATVAAWSCTGIASSDFSAAAWSCVAWIASSDFSTTGWSARIARFNATAWSVAVKLVLHSYELTLQVALEPLECIQNWSANAAAAWFACRCTRWCTSYFNTAARSCVAWVTSGDFNATGWIACGFNAARRITYRGIAARARRSAAFPSEQTVQKVATKALSAKGSSNNHRTDNDIPFHLSQISLRIWSLTVTHRPEMCG